MEGTPVTFLLFNPGCSGITGYQWQRWQGNDWINIPGADSTFYTITPLLADSGAQFRVWVDRSPCVSLASLATTLSVTSVVPIFSSQQVPGISLTLHLAGSFKRFDLPKDTRRIRVSLLDIVGKTTFSRTLELAGGRTPLALSFDENWGLPVAGIYLMQVSALGSGGQLLCTTASKYPLRVAP